MCEDSMTFKCNKCHSAAYCSIDCQKRDEELHGLLCGKIATFFEENPRPENTLLTTHKLAILLPRDSQDPEFMWVKFDLVVKANGTCQWKFFDNLHQLPFGLDPEIHYVSCKGYSVGICRSSTDCDMAPEVSNVCLTKLTEGYSSCQKDWVFREWERMHNVLVLGLDARDEESKFNTYRDTTLADFRFALDHFSLGLNTFEGKEHNHYVIRKEKDWIHGVMISCSGDVNYLDVEKYRGVEIRKDHPFFKYNWKSSPIFNYLDLLLGVMKYPEDEELMENPGYRGDILRRHENRAAARFLADDKNDEILGAGYRGKWEIWGEGHTALVVRMDRRDISAKQIEALAGFLEDHVTLEESSKQTRVKNEKAYFERMAQQQKGEFEEFFKSFKEGKLRKGDKTWADVISPLRDEYVPPREFDRLQEPLIVIDESEDSQA